MKLLEGDKQMRKTETVENCYDSETADFNSNSNFYICSPLVENKA